MATRTIELDQKNLEAGIQALSSAAQAFRLTPFERRAYRALMVSVDVAAWSFVAYIFISELASVTFAFAVVVGIVSLGLNIPLLRKLYRERARLKELGLSSLSKSLWKESRRNRWISRARRALLIVVGILIFVMAVFFGGLMMTDVENRILFLFMALFFATIAALIFSARYLRNQRERMELTESAEELKKALQGLQQRAGKAEVVSVPSELLEEAARVESAQIAKERKDAVLQSVALRPSGYAITFDRDAAEERATLAVGDRIELGDLVAQLSIEGPGKLESQAGAVADAEGATLRGMTESQRVEIEYVIDQASHSIRIVAVRHGGDDSHGSLKGASHA